MYRMNKSMPFLFNIGVGIPKMVNSVSQGLSLLLIPLTVILQRYQLMQATSSEAVVSGLVTPDTYLIDKVTFDIIKTTIGSKETMCVYREQGNDILQKDVLEEKRGVSCLSLQEIKELARIGKLIEQYYGKAYDIEFGIDADYPFPDNIIILQVRPESVWSKKEAEARWRRKDPMDRLLSNLLAGVKIK